MTLEFNYVTWFVIIFFLGAYIRLYDPKIIIRNAGFKLVALIIIDVFSIVLQYRFFHAPYFFIMDVNKLLAVLTAIYLFAFFKNLKLGYHPRINVISTATFGVLLIHANSDTMRNWLWGSILKNVEAYSKPWWFIHALCSVIGVYTVCTIIDLFRIRLLERPFFRWYDRHEGQIICSIQSRLSFHKNGF